MAKRKNAEAKRREGRCQGFGKEYVPFTKVQEFSSRGTCHVVRNWLNGRRTHLLSTAEMEVFYSLNWIFSPIDIREQFALFDMDDVNNIASHLKFRKPQGYLSTDMLVTLRDGRDIAVSVKANREQVRKDRRGAEKLLMEKIYWSERDTPYWLLFGEDMNRMLVKNVRLVSEIYDTKLIQDDVTAIKHLILHKIILVPEIGEKELNFNELLEIYEAEVSAFYDYLDPSERPYWRR